MRSAEFINPGSILRYHWPDSEELNEQLRDAILAKERWEPGRRVSAIGGWRSESFLQDWKEPSVDALIVKALLMLDEMEVRCPPTIPTGRDLTMWANVNRNGDYNRRHHHHSHRWAGVYYVDPGDGPESGLTRFQLGKSGEFLSQPVAGLMLFFPGTAPHSVDVYKGKRPRISIAFNVGKL